MKSIGEIKALIELCREQSLTKVEIDGVTFHITPKTEITRRSLSEEIKPEDLISPLSAFDEPGDDEVLFYSSPYYDELQAEKEKRKEALNEQN